ncbi:MAG: sulfite exporter TauE/SafE family protein [Armatimonadota bacterium]|nr:sulfite exporter TauE/SafE family protein [Armatimonadota bacterium]
MSFLSGIGAYLGVGSVVGVISGLFGIGGGVLMVPAIIFIWQKEPKIAVATSLAVMIPGAIAGVLRHHFSYGVVDWRIAAGLAVGAIVGSFAIGAPLANWLPVETLKKGFGVLLVVSGLKMAGVFDFVGAKLSNVAEALMMMLG